MGYVRDGRYIKFTFHKWWVHDCSMVKASISGTCNVVSMIWGSRIQTLGRTFSKLYVNKKYFISSIFQLLTTNHIVLHLLCHILKL